MKKRRHRRRAPSPKYANDVQFSPGAWDLGLSFGTYLADPSSGELKLDGHTAVTVPWGVVKTMIYGFTMSVIAFEKQHGVITVPAQLVPPLPPQDCVGPDGLVQMALARAELFPAAEADPPDRISNVLLRGLKGPTH